MQVRLEQVRDRPFHWDETETVGADEIGHPDLVALSPVHWRGEIRFADPGYLLTADISYRQTLSCQRCLLGGRLLRQIGGGLRDIRIAKTCDAGLNRTELRNYAGLFPRKPLFSGTIVDLLLIQP